MTAAAIAGYGEAGDFHPRPDRTSLELCAEAAIAALADAGLGAGAIDGLITGRSLIEPYGLYAHVLAEYLGMTPRQCLTLSVGGATGTTGVALAAEAVSRGECRAVLVVYGDARGSPPSGDWRLLRGVIGDVVSHPEFEAPFGTTAITAGALTARRHMEEYGTTLDQLGSVAVAARAHASRNPKALRRGPLELEATRHSPVVASPLRAVDCSLISDFAAAVIVTSLPDASALGRTAVRILGSGGATAHKHVVRAPSLTSTAAVESGRRAFERAGVGPQDVSVVELYDAFTIHVVVLLEDLAFCERGGGGPFAASGAIAPGGRIPCNTHGGMLSCAHGGSLLVTEAVRQLRGEGGDTQVPGARLALVHGIGGTFSAHSTIILGT